MRRRWVILIILSGSGLIRADSAHSSPCLHFLPFCSYKILFSGVEGQLNNFPASLISRVHFMTQFWPRRHKWMSAEGF